MEPHTVADISSCKPKFILLSRLYMLNKSKRLYCWQDLIQSRKPSCFHLLGSSTTHIQVLMADIQSCKPSRQLLLGQSTISIYKWQIFSPANPSVTCQTLFMTHLQYLIVNIQSCKPSCVVQVLYRTSKHSAVRCCLFIGSKATDYRQQLYIYAQGNLAW